MTKNLLSIIAFGALFLFCQKIETTNSSTDNNKTDTWSIESLSTRAAEQLDSTKWDLALFKQDIDTYNTYPEVFISYPLNKSPFPIAEYDYAVSSIPFIIKTDTAIFKGIRIGELLDPESDIATDKLTLLVLTNDIDSNESTLVESRNYPYLTAQGTFEISNNELDWVFSASPDGYSSLMLNMKLFDLRFGETIVIYPQNDKSFLYHQIEDSPNNYPNFDDFKQSILDNPVVKNQLSAVNNIK